MQFDSWSGCSISNLFWKSLAEIKLDEIGKGSCRRKLWAFYQVGSSEIRLTAESLLAEEPKSVAELGNNFYCLPGQLMLADSIEEFKALDRASEAQKLAQDNSTTKETNFFLLFAFADVKRYRFYHQIAYPVLVLKEQFKVVHEEMKKSTLSQTYSISADTIKFVDSLNNAWPLRQLLTKQQFARKQVTIVTPKRTLTVQVPALESSGISGWERSREDPKKVAPIKCTDLAGLFDSKQLARQAAELNLKLMKWRLVPDLDLEIISKTKCLLIGSGTLGCNIARVLLGWGFKNITFVDHGKVSYSNPVRQSLFTFEDAKQNKSKALAAAERLAQIDPNVKVRGVELQIPMPGHPVLDENEANDQICKLEKLVYDHDVVFLLTDSRESRWFPSLLGTFFDKIVLTVALGFDSYVAMRHGRRSLVDRKSCYFCHDVIGPSDTMSGRSLDQQCTVTRPGLSFVAAGQAVELLVSLLQSEADSDKSRLGRIPHQIRGNMSNFECYTLTGEASETCTACSPSIQQAYMAGPMQFLIDACASPSCLEKISGLTAIKELAESLEMMTSLDDCDFEDI